MSLDWNTTKVQYFKDHPDELWVKIKTNFDEYDDVNAETKALIFGSMAVGLGSITNANAPEWYARWKLLEEYDGLYLYRTFGEGTDEKVYLTPEVLLKHINLSTNVSNTTTAAWCKNFVRPSSFKSENRPTLEQAKAIITVRKMEFNKLIEMEKV